MQWDRHFSIIIQKSVAGLDTLSFCFTYYSILHFLNIIILIAEYIIYRPLFSSIADKILFRHALTKK